MSLSDPGLSQQFILDGRGRRVELGHPRIRQVAHEVSDPEWRAYLLESRRQVRRLGRRFRGAVALFFMLLGAAAAPLYWYLPTNGSGLTGLSRLAPSLMMAWLGIAVWFGNFGFRGAGVRDALLRRGLCPSCLDALSGDIEEDGCAVCPECGAAWRLVAAMAEGPLGAP